MKTKRATAKQVYKACKYLESQEMQFSCAAIWKAVGYSDAAQDYAGFYKQLVFDNWGNAFGGFEDKGARQLALLMYLEARDDVGPY